MPFFRRRPRLTRAILSICVLVASTPAALADACTPPDGLFKTTKTPEPGSPVPASTETVVDADGTEIAIADFAGRGVVLNFWATWCAPCVREMPMLNAAKPALAEDGIAVVTVSEDRAEIDRVQRYMAQNQWANLPVLLDPDSRLIRDLGGPGLPFTILLDDKGREKLRALGMAEWDAPEMRDFLVACLKGGG